MGLAGMLLATTSDFSEGGEVLDLPQLDFPSVLALLARPERLLQTFQCLWPAASERERVVLQPMDLILT